MKGLQHKVIEISDPKDSEIDKILIFMKPGEHSVNVANTREKAQLLLANMQIKKRPWFNFNFQTLTFMAILSIILLFIGIIMFFI